jgi:hypothetical protein
MISGEGSKRLNDCHCPSGYYDRLDAAGTDAPVICYDSGGKTLRSVLGEPDNTDSAQGFATNQRCLECPGCLQCKFDKYSGQPSIREGYTVVGASTQLDGYALSEQLGSKNEIDASVQMQRDVFACPWGSAACRGEREFRNVSDDESLLPCALGYAGDLCGFCEEDWSLTKQGCKRCAKVGDAVQALLVLCLLIAVLSFAKQEYRKRAAVGKHVKGSNIVEILKILARVVPELVADIKVVIGVSQTLTNMGSTLSLTFPPQVEAFLAEQRGLVNFDIFSFPAISCILSGNFYIRLWASLLVPLLILVTLYVFFSDRLKTLHLDHVPDIEQDEEARLYIEAESKARRDSERENQESWHTEDQTRHRRDKTTESGVPENNDELRFAPHADSESMRKRVHRIRKKQRLENETLSWAFFVIFLALPSCTDKIFALFYCIEMDASHSFLAADLSISCTTTTHAIHMWIGGFLIAAVVLGIPLGLGHQIWKFREEIRAHKGPAHLENLYDSYKPENPLWEVYQMLQKTILIGLLSFVDRGSILQSLIGLVVSNLVLMAFVRQQPYAKHQTNILSITGQAVIVLSYLSAVLLRIDLGSEAFTADAIGGVIIAANVPMGVYLVYDTFVTMRDELSKAQIDLLTSELGGAGATYVCKTDVEITSKLHYRKHNKKVTGQVKEGEKIVAIKQAFNSKGDARLRIEGGWVSFSSGGLLGDRHFATIDSSMPEKTGKLRFRIERSGPRLIVTILRARGLQDKDLVGKNDVYVVVYVNGERKQTSTLQNAGANATWNGEHGEVLDFGIDGSLDAVELECWDADDAGSHKYTDAHDVAAEDDLIGVCVFPVKAFEDAGDTWGPWEGSRILRQRQTAATESETGKSEAIDTEDEMINPIATSSMATFDVEGEAGESPRGAIGDGLVDGGAAGRSGDGAATDV